MQLNKTIIGMVHVQALPGTPNNKHSIEEICEIAVQEAKTYEEVGLDAIMIENMHDVPYLKGAVGPEITASMAVVAKAIREAVNLPLGIQILAGANKEALAVAKAANFQFMRAEGFVFGHVADEGYIDSCAGELLRYRKAIGAEDVKIFTDIKKKHSSHALTSDVDIDETAKAAEFFLSDGLIVTGSSTGKAVYLHELKSLKDKVQIPVLIGSGITAENLEEYWNYAAGFIVGSHFKENGFWKNSISKDRLKIFVEKVKQLRK
ncbi:BtpA family membrane complex biogenesis protein [Marinifilum breve]|uniref:BtpA family membrane complex biogenesis protein n=1 Tax=Marinifilum breve TaxID=2184082 RepID=A0A2V3ZQV8_9BACT|nr:BtpA/SgcQ family protein [Marinifilum breve]PXX95733.1 BtpA family membrane complex biogenesis protein [Marinifilum breve]